MDKICKKRKINYVEPDKDINTNEETKRRKFRIFINIKQIIKQYKCNIHDNDEDICSIYDCCGN